MLNFVICSLPIIDKCVLELKKMYLINNFVIFYLLSVYYNEWLPNDNAYRSSALYHARIRQYHRPVRQSFFPNDENRSQSDTEYFDNVNYDKNFKFPSSISGISILIA